MNNNTNLRLSNEEAARRVLAAARAAQLRQLGAQKARLERDLRSARTDRVKANRALGKILAQLAQL